MLLAIDIGNTNIVIGAVENNKVKFSSRIKSDTGKTEWEYAIMISDLFALHDVLKTDFDGAAISSVVPSLTGMLSLAVGFLGIEKIVTVAAGVKTGMNIKIDDPGSLGADLVCTAVAAIEKYPLPAIIIDLGTATKMFVVDQNKNFIGGAIFPGVIVSLSALSTSAAQLPHIGLDRQIKLIGTNTIDCMLSGSILGTASMLDSMVGRYIDELKNIGTVVACGGLSKSIVPHCKTDIIIDENLLLDGLTIIYEKNK